MTTTSTQNDLASGMEAHRQGDLENAEKFYRRILEFDTNDQNKADAYQLLALLVKARGELDQAEVYFRQSLGINKRQPNVLNNFGNLLTDTNRVEEAIQTYRRAVTIDAGFLDGWMNLGTALHKAKQLSDAETALRRALQIDDKAVRVHNSLGAVYKDWGKIYEAIECFQKALEIEPRYELAFFNLGTAYRMINEPASALECLRNALMQNPQNALAYCVMGSIYNQLDQIDDAKICFKSAIAIDPELEDAHYELNQMLWMAGDHDEFLESFKEAEKLKPNAFHLRLRHADIHQTQDEYEKSEPIIREALEIAPDDARANDAMARCYTLQGRFEEAVPHHAKAAHLGRLNPYYFVSEAKTLIYLGRYQDALEVLEKCDPAICLYQQMDAERIALLELCYRNLGDPRSHYINDYDNFVGAQFIETPPGYRNLDAFNRKLAQKLDEMHTMKHHPLEQTLRNGSQTYGSLFDSEEPIIVELRDALKIAIQKHIDALPDDPDHPFLSRKTKDFAFVSSWSVRLNASGFHKNHVHGNGWISSAYYVQVPSEVSGSSEKAGWLKFGQPNRLPGHDQEPHKWIEPEVGKLGLFPSYMWHGTEPFHSDSHRMTVAFDILPVPDES